jgi:uncharacterized protein
MRIVWLVKLAVLTCLLPAPACSDTSGTPEPFPLSSVKITKGPFFNAQQTGMQYILELDPDRLLHPFLREAGLTPLAESYGNWENTGLDGHTAGHYLSALSLMYASTGEAELRKRLEYMTEWLARCQEANGNNYVGGIPGGRDMWEEIAAGNIDAANFSLNGKWVPWYNIHKLYAGLRDACLYAGNEKALSVLVNLSDWCLDLVKDLSDDQIQEMLVSEHGGMNEVFVDVAELTGEPKYLRLAEKFSHRLILDPLLKRENRLTGLHANTQIPKVVGFQRYAAATGDSAWNSASEFFWEIVINKWTVSIGGNSVAEHFHPPDDYSSMLSSNQGPETCNTYNMLRLTKNLYFSSPQSRYIDYYERALYNHILSSVHPSRPGFVYFTPMRPDHYRVYSQPGECFWCCVGSGLENHGKYGEMIYTRAGRDIFVNLFIPSVLTWEEGGITLIQDTEFPFEEKSEIILELGKPSRFALSIRIPDWLNTGELVVSVNGEAKTFERSHSGFATINRQWNNGDIVAISLPMKTRVEYLPDGSPWASIIHGPLVLAAPTGKTGLDGLFADGSRWGHIASGPHHPAGQIPAITVCQHDLCGRINPVEGRPLAFEMQDVIHQPGKDSLTLIPFFQVHESRYTIYWPVITPE